jgi:hypothetical protein
MRLRPPTSNGTDMVSELALSKIRFSVSVSRVSLVRTPPESKKLTEMMTYNTVNGVFGKRGMGPSAPKDPTSRRSSTFRSRFQTDRDQQRDGRQARNRSCSERAPDGITTARPTYASTRVSTGGLHAQSGKVMPVRVTR